MILRRLYEIDFDTHYYLGGIVVLTRDGRSLTPQRGDMVDDEGYLFRPSPWIELSPQEIRDDIATVIEHWSKSS